MAKEQHVQIRCTAAEKERWESEAASAGCSSVSDWIRGRLNAALTEASGGIDPVLDPQFGDALDRLTVRGGHRRPADAIRSAVVTFRGLLDEAGIDPVELLDRTRKALPGASAKKR